MSWRRKLQKNLRKLYAANVQLEIDERSPILVYQMGKVGSSSVRDSLWAKDLGPVFHLHAFHPWRREEPSALPVDEEHRQAVVREIDQEVRAFQGASFRTKIRRLLLSRWYYGVIYDKVIARGRRAKIVTMVREPASTNVSMFFQSFEDYAGQRFKKSRYSTEEIIAIFEENYLFSWPLTWFDKEMKRTLGVDVYDHPFPKEKGYRTIQESPYEVLVLKCELSDAKKEQALANFLGTEDFEIIRRNESKDKAYARHYREFKERVSLPADVLDQLLRSKYAQHFYTDEELERARAKWSA